LHITPVLKRLRQEDQEFKASLSYVARRNTVLKKQKEVSLKKSSENRERTENSMLAHLGKGFLGTSELGKYFGSLSRLMLLTGSLSEKEVNSHELSAPTLLVTLPDDLFSPPV
jgi:hypothetical protein